MARKIKGRKAVVLLSGGIDSSACLALAVSRGYTCHTLAVDYGQRHRVELRMAARQARAFGVRKHLVVKVDLSKIGGSALTSGIEVPKEDLTGGVPITYVPARNTIFLSLGLAWAEVLGAQDLFIGVNQVDFSGYPDCRKSFVEAFERMANLATCMGCDRRSIRVHAPLIDRNKAEIIRLGVELGVDHQNTHSCYDPGPRGKACGCCPSCRLRLRGFAEAGLSDPVSYRKR